MSAAASVKLARHLKELRIHLCQRSPASQGVRDFIANHYVALKSANPGLSILIRECSNAPAALHARYERGREQAFDLSNATSEQVLQTVVQQANR
ncbi:hypothetical protein BOX15_Mlig015020g1 [Macrostomum lignano]|uniref:NADH dehydrogenase [ubiquinone] 1 alpha subcomplex subunit 2 n=1 Tax=Macrostomum lignano TaxID=282301 RepID=A0A267H5K0_9PLAT|nr:hypothetical protein BOX15_Mlig015020g1 [Macrostomum lignano]